MNPVYLFSLIIFCWTVQGWLVLILLSAGIPQASSLNALLCPEWQFALRPERDALFYHGFVALALGAQAVGIWFWRDKLSKGSFAKILFPLMATELVWTALMLNASFKSVVYPTRSLMAHNALVFLSTGALLSKIFWTELSVLGKSLYSKLTSWKFDRRADLLACAGIIVVLYITDPKAVLARMFFGDHFHHWDGTVMAPGWAFLKGGILNVDVISQYGIGWPIIVAGLAKSLGGFGYDNVFQVLLWLCVIYFILCFVFLRSWLGSFAISVAGTLLAIKFQLFHFTMAPIAFTFPDGTVTRFFWDIIFFLLLWGHLRTLNLVYLFAAAVCCGLQVFYVTVCGYCLVIALLTYSAVFLIAGHLRGRVCRKYQDFIWFCLPALAAPLMWFALMAVTQGSHLWTPQFWLNMQEFNNYFLSGFGLMPLYESFQNKEVLTGLMGLIIPLVYMWTFLVTGAWVYLGLRGRKEVMVFVLSVYGLAMYHYYMGRSGVDGYYTVSIPYVFILCYWVQYTLESLKPSLKKGVLVSLLGLVVYALFSNSLYLSYPNILNLSRNPIVDPAMVQPLSDGSSYFNASVSKIKESEKLPVNSLGEKDEGIRHENDFKTDDELKNFYAQESDFSKDAALIDSLTRPSEPVALLSGFEIKMLMAADRRQFFYYSPILVTRPMRMRTFPNSMMFSSGHALRTIRQLDEAKPGYIFMEKIFLQAPGTKDFKDSSLAAVLNYIFVHYQPYEQGQYLVAFKRK